VAKTDIWMPLYVADYLGDTMRLTTEQHGAYLLLIMDYWRNGPLPDDDSSLSSITKLPVSTWRKYRPMFEKLFKVSEGAWRHKRIDEELQQAQTNSEKYEQRARKAANKRWGNQPEKPAEKPAEKPSPSSATSTPQAVLGHCTSPTPSPSKSRPEVIHTESVTPVSELETTGQARVILIQSGSAGSCCKAMMRQGIGGCNPSHPTLLALLEAGATEDEFIHAAKNAVSKGKANFSYVVGTVRRQREEAAKLVLHQGRMPGKPEKFDGLSYVMRNKNEPEDRHEKVIN